MRILQMVDSLGIGGAQKLLVTFARVAPQRGMRVSVLSLSAERDTSVERDLRKAGAQLSFYPAGRLLDLRRLSRIVRYLRQEKFDLIQTHLSYANVVGVLAGRLAGVPVVATLHSTGVDPRHHNPWREKLEALVLRFGARRVVAVAEKIAEVHQPSLGSKPIDVIPNAVLPGEKLPAAERAALRRALVGDETRPLVMAVGRLSPPKGYPDLIEAFALVRQEHPRAALVIVGGGVLRAELLEKIAALGLQDHVLLAGHRDDVPALLAAADIFVVSSHWEGLPLGVLEAMSASLPVVATQVGEMASLVLPGMGRLVPPHQPAQLAEALNAVLSSPEQWRAWGAAGQAHILQHYGASRWLDRLAALYGETAGRRRFELSTRGGIQ